jgi:hypothetical protein
MADGTKRKYNYHNSTPERAEKNRQRVRAWYAANKERALAYQHAYQKAHYVPAVRRSIEERFWAKVDKTEGCWLWKAAISGGRRGAKERGYGYFGITSKNIVRAHRWSYEQAYGPIPRGLVLDHLCRVARCVRPEHLRAVTQAENIRAYRLFVNSQKA